MTKRKVVIYGAGGQGKVVCDALERDETIEILGFLDRDSSRWGQSFFGHPILGGPDARPIPCEHAIVAIGDNEERGRVVGALDKNGFQFIKAIHPSAIIARGVEIGEGSMILPGVVINAGTVIGKHVIINSHATIEHDCRVDSFAHVASGVHTGSWVTVGAYTLLGTGASVRLKTNIGAHVTVGAGAVVVKDVPDGVVVVGNPAIPLVKKNT